MIIGNEETRLEEGEASTDFIDMEETNPNKHTDGHLRSLLKAVSWRFLATTSTVIISYFVTGDVSSALEIGAIEFFVKIFVYYCHERLWLCCNI